MSNKLMVQPENIQTLHITCHLISAIGKLAVLLAKLSKDRLNTIKQDVWHAFDTWQRVTGLNYIPRNTGDIRSKPANVLLYILATHSDGKQVIVPVYTLIQSLFLSMTGTAWQVMPSQRDYVSADGTDDVQSYADAMVTYNEWYKTYINNLAAFWATTDKVFTRTQFGGWRLAAATDKSSKPAKQDVQIDVDDLTF